MPAGAQTQAPAASATSSSTLREIKDANGQTQQVDKLLRPFNL